MSSKTKGSQKRDHEHRYPHSFLLHCHSLSPLAVHRSFSTNGKRRGDHGAGGKGGERDSEAAIAEERRKRMRRKENSGNALSREPGGRRTTLTKKNGDRWLGGHLGVRARLGGLFLAPSRYPTAR